MTIRYEILDASGNLIGNLSPEKDKASVSFSASGRNARTLDGLRLSPTEAAKVTAGKHRIRPVWDGQSLGVFLWLGGTEERIAGATWIDGAPLPDRSYQLDQPLSEPFGLAAGSSITDGLAELVEGSGIPGADVDVQASPRLIGSVPLGWPAGGPTRLEIAARLCALLGYLPPYFNRAGRFVARAVPTVALEAPTLVYARGRNSQIVAESTKVASNIAERPNVYLVRSTGPTGGAIFSRYQVPASAPNSVEEIGYERVAVVDEPGLASEDHADEVARARARSDAFVVRTVEFTTTPQTAHDAFDIVEWEGERMIELGWSLPLSPGGAHRHTLRTEYPDA